MLDPLPWEVLLGQLPDGFHYQLPPRQLGRLRFVGLFLILNTLTVGGLLLLALLHADGPSWWLRAGLAVATLAVVRSLVRLGFLIFCGHSQIHLRQGRLTALEFAGLFLRRRSVSWGDVRRLSVTTLPLVQPGVIVADCAGGRRLWLAPGYPLRILAPLARDLARRCAQLAGSEAIPVRQCAPSPAAPAFAEHAIEQERLHPPPDSRVRVTECADGVTVVVPAAGVWRGSRGLFAFSLLWCATLAGLTMLAGNRGVFAGLLGGCWAVSVLLLLVAVARGRRRVLLTVANETLVLRQRGLFRTDRQDWVRDELLEITIGPSFWKDRDVPLLELKIWEFTGHFTSLLAGRDAADLAYLATTLRHALDLPLSPEMMPRLDEATGEVAEPPEPQRLRRASQAGGPAGRSSG